LYIEKELLLPTYPVSEFKNQTVFKVPLIVETFVKSVHVIPPSIVFTILEFLPTQ